MTYIICFSHLLFQVIIFILVLFLKNQGKQRGKFVIIYLNIAIFSISTSTEQNRAHNVLFA